MKISIKPKLMILLLILIVLLCSIYVLKKLQIDDNLMYSLIKYQLVVDDDEEKYLDSLAQRTIIDIKNFEYYDHSAVIIGKCTIEFTDSQCIACIKKMKEYLNSNTVKIVVYKDKNSYGRAEINGKNDTIFLSTSLINDEWMLKKTVIHEIAHLVWRGENHGRSSNCKYYTFNQPKAEFCFAGSVKMFPESLLISNVKKSTVCEILK